MAGTTEIIVMSGVTQGIGNGMAELYLSQGHTVIGCGRSEEKIAQLNEKYKDNMADFSVVDISKEEQVKHWVKKTLGKFGAPTFLINCAGIINENRVFWEISGEEFDQVIDINIKDYANVLRHFIPAMIEAKRGVIVNFSSGAGRIAEKHMSAYCSSKFGVEGLSQSLALELPEPLTCVTVDPGLVNTYMLKKYFEGTNSDPEGEVSVERWIQVACPFFLGLSRADNGTSFDAPSIPEVNK